MTTNADNLRNRLGGLLDSSSNTTSGVDHLGSDLSLLSLNPLKSAPVANNAALDSLINPNPPKQVAQAQTQPQFERVAATTNTTPATPAEHKDNGGNGVLGFLGGMGIGTLSFGKNLVGSFFWDSPEQVQKALRAEGGSLGS